MPNLDKTGPEGKGSKTGRKLGKCIKSREELKQVGELGIGQGRRYHAFSSCGEGKKKRLKYYLNKNK